MTQIDLKQLENIILNTIEDGVFFIDKGGLIQLLNPAGFKILELKEEVLGQNWQDILTLTDNHGTYLKELNNPIEQALLKHETIRKHDAYLLSKNNNKVPIHIILTPLRGNQGEFQGIIGVMREISFEKQLEEAKTDFVSTASHEMRTPLASIEGYLSLLLDKDLDNEAKTYLDHAHKTTLYLGQLFKDLLTTSQSEDGKLQHDPVVFNLIDLINDLIVQYQKPAQLKDINLKIKEISVSNHLIYADPKRIEELLINILDNSIKYTNKSGYINLSVFELDKYLQIQIQDNGLGISEKNLPHIFQKFYRINNDQPGTGLGLFICKKIVELYKGSLWAESNKEKGSIFYINLLKHVQE